ncbi:MAG TPA: phosphate ABC transporter ATP-binding protein, partial [Actinomycetota bacterium]|nr:phosphate ABC transporter ATP-binding protein [Actinomycetota bacterium]
EMNASFQRGAVSAIVGPSGAGKTSVLRCLNRLEEPSSGSVLLDTSDITTIDPIQLRRRVGMIFQTPALFEGGVRGNLAYGLTDVSDVELRRALRSAGLDEEFLERDSSALSVGQAQRVCIARALVRKPEILLMDEPTSALDRDAAARIELLLTSLNETGLSVVLVTHNLDQALRLAHYAILLVDGRVVATGTPREVTGEWPREGTS